jgi:hypothetical protein
MGNLPMGTHESFERNAAAHPPSERSFAWVFAAFFAAVALWPAWRGRPVRWWALGVAARVFLAGLVRPSVLRIPNLVWFRFGSLLNRVVSPVAASLLFFAVFTPFAVVLRMAGKDLLRLRRDPAAASYWIDRDPPGPPPESMAEQF